MSERIDISGLDKAALLQVLHAAANRIPGAGEIVGPMPLSLREARNYISAFQKVYGRLVFNMIQGRWLDVDLSGDTLDPIGYDAHNGEGAAQAAVDHLRREMVIDHEKERERHEKLGAAK